MYYKGTIKIIALLIFILKLSNVCVCVYMFENFFLKLQNCITFITERTYMNLTPGLVTM